MPKKLTAKEKSIPAGRIAPRIVRHSGPDSTEALRESQRMLTTLLGNLPGMVYRCRNDKDWTMDFVSEGCLNLTGHPPDDFLGNAVRSYAQIVHADDRERVWNEVQDAVAARRSFELTYRIATARGPLKWVCEQGCGVYAADGSLLCLEGYITDITERQQAEEKLRESEERFRGLFNISSDWYWESDAQLRFSRFEGRYVQRYNSFYSGFLGKDIWDSGVSIESTEEDEQTHRAMLQNREPFYNVVTYVTQPDGSRFYMSVSGEPRFDEHSHFLGYRGIARNITKQKLIEQATLRLGWMYAALSATNEAILRAQSPEELYQKVCDAAVHGGRFIATGVLLVDRNAEWAKVVAFTGVGAKELREARISIDASRAEGRGMVGTAFRERTLTVSNDYANDDRMRPWQKAAQAFGVRAAAAVPLFRGDEVSGVLLLYSNEKDAFDEEIAKLLERMAEDVSFALENFERDQERKHAEQRLRDSEARFRALVNLSSDWYFEQDAEIRFTRLEGRFVGNNSESFQSLIGKRPWEAGIEDEAGGHADRVLHEARQPLKDLVLRTPVIDGRRGYIQVSGEPVFDGEGNFTGYRGIGRNITRQKLNEQATLRLGRMYAALSATNEAILRARSAEELYQKVCDAAVHGSKFLATGIVLRNKQSDQLSVAAHTGIGGEAMRNASLSIDESRPEGRALIGTAYRARKTAITNDYLNDERMRPWYDVARTVGIAACAAIPLVKNEQFVGALVFHSSEKDAFDDEIVKLLERMAENVVFALDNFERERERKGAELALRESEERFKHLTELSSDWFWEQDEELRFTMIAYSQGSRPRHPPETLLGRRRWEVPFYPDMVESDWAPLKQSAAARLPFRDFLIKRRGPEGEITYSAVSGVPIYDEQGTFKGYRGTGRDVTDRMRTEGDMRKLSGAIEQTADCVMITDRDGTIEYVNAAFERTTGYTATESLGRRPSLLKSEVHGKAFYERLWNTILGGETFSDVFVNRKKDGELYYEEKRVSPLRDGEGRITHFISTGRDITERMQAQERLQHIAHHDALTGLPNRVLFLDRLNQALIRAHWQKRVVGVMFLDLDRFKNINDTLGHDTGDALLKAMAARLQGCVRAGDSVARLGGDEFAILLEDVAHAEDISTIAGKILGAFTLPFAIQGHELFITASIGISMFPTDGTTPATLLKNADAAMYRAKDLGKNNYQFYSADMSAAAFERLTLESSLRRALEREEFVLHYQPQFDLTTGQVIAIEALIRWQHPEFGLLAPTQFISIAEETGAIVQVGEWVARKAMVQIQRWREAGFGPLRVAVNVSGRQFNEPNFVDTIAYLLEETGLPAEALELEITESVIMKNAEKTVARLRALHAMGVRFAIDDFGTGYSSLSYLRRFAIHTLKIDKSFIRDITSDSGDAEIVKTIIMMARGLKLSVIAEGVETAEQLVFLRSHGCHAVQGHVLARPLSVEHLTEQLRQHHNRSWLP